MFRKYIIFFIIDKNFGDLVTCAGLKVKETKKILAINDIYIEY